MSRAEPWPRVLRPSDRPRLERPDAFSDRSEDPQSVPPPAQRDGPRALSELVGVVGEGQILLGRIAWDLARATRRSGMTE
jgi:hypothetical protein